MIIDPTIYANLILTVIAVILLLFFITAVLILLSLKKAFPVIKGENEIKLTEKKEERTTLKEGKESDPSKLYQSKSIEENLIGLFKHYHLTSFTMATSDGLVISSTDPNSDEDAANYSYLYLQGKQPESPNVRLIGVPHKGGTVVGIIKSEDELSETDLILIERDIRFILRKNL